MKYISQSLVIFNIQYQINTWQKSLRVVCSFDFLKILSIHKLILFHLFYLYCDAILSMSHPVDHSFFLTTWHFFLSVLIEEFEFDFECSIIPLHPLYRTTHSNFIKIKVLFWKANFRFEYLWTVHRLFQMLLQLMFCCSKTRFWDCLY